MPLRQRHVNVARLADGFAVVQHFQHRKEAGVFLQQTRNRIEHPGTPVTAQLLPAGLCLAGRADGVVHIGLAGLAEAGQHLARGRVLAVETVGGRGKAAVDELAKAAALIDDPCQRLCGGFRGRAIVHRLENIRHAHCSTSFESRGPLALACRMAIACGIIAGHMMLQLPLYVIEQR